MNLLAFVDLHEDKKAFKRIKFKAKNANLIVCAGDISNFGANLEKLLSELNELGKTVLIIPGNHEMDYELKKLCKKFKNIHDIHESHFRKKNYLFLGYGGGGFSIEDKEFDKISLKFKKIIKKSDKVILVTHAPVYGTKLDYLMWLKDHRGNISIRRFVEDINPELVICGHFHENDSKVDRIKKTMIINPGKQGKLIKIKEK